MLTDTAFGYSKEVWKSARKSVLDNVIHPKIKYMGEKFNSDKTQQLVNIAVVYNWKIQHAHTHAHACTDSHNAV